MFLYHSESGFWRAKRVMVLIILVGLIMGGFFVYSLIPKQVHNRDVSGVLARSQIWSGQVNVTGDITVLPWVTLTILPGTVVKVAALSDDQRRGFDHPRDSYFPKDPDRIETQSIQFIIRGTLNAIGTPDNKIIFTSDSKNPTTYDWDGLTIFHGKIEWAIVEYARYNNPMSSDVVLANSIVRNSLECCIGVGHSKPVSPQILNNDIYNCGHEGMDIAGGSPLIKGNHFHLRENPEIQPDPPRGGNGIVIYKNAYPIIEGNIFEKNSTAIAFTSNFLHQAEEGKKVILRNNRIENNDIGISIGPDYPFDIVVMENNQLINNKQDRVPHD